MKSHYKTKRDVSGNVSTSFRKTWSEWPDSNGRPLAPHARMLANCTTPRLLSRRKNTKTFYTLSIFL